MKYATLFKFTPIFLLFLFSCRTSSNAVFEKRKHLKGWHFKKNKKFKTASTTPKSKVDNAEIKTLKSRDVSNLTSTVVTIENHSNQELKNTNNHSCSGCNEHLDFIHVDKGNIGFPVKNHETKKSKIIDSTNDFQKNTHPISSVRDGRIIANDYEESSFKERYFEEKKEKDNGYLYGPIGITLAIIGLLYLYFMGLGVALVLGFFVISAGLSWALGIVTWMLLGYVFSAFFIYLLLRLFIREDREVIWTLKETFLKTIWFALIVPILALVFMLTF